MNSKSKNKDGRINFLMYFIDDINKWGYQIVDTIEDETLKRDYGYESFQEARKAGFEAAKKIIDEMNY